MDKRALTDALRGEVLRLGFNSVGVCPAVTPLGIHRFRDWLDAGYAGDMRYLPDRARAYEHPQHVLDGARSLVLMSMVYQTREPTAPTPGQGLVSRYAWGGADYHDVIHRRLQELVAFLDQYVPHGRSRGVVDTAPLLEREFAQLAGLGWIGKNTLLLNRRWGSWFFLAALLTDQELEYDRPHDTDHCGRCRACLDACPTGAFPRPYVLDATRCISYLTIEHRGAIPESLREAMGPWVFGCDVCQEVCPWNHRTPPTGEPVFEPDPHKNPLDLIRLFDLDDVAFRERFRSTPLWRAKRRGLLRNAAIALANRPCPQAIPALIRGLGDGEPLVRAACAWALGRYQETEAVDALRARRVLETDPDVREEIEKSANGGEGPP